MIALDTDHPADLLAQMRVLSIRAGTSIYAWDPEGGIAPLRETGLYVPGTKRLADALWQHPERLSPVYAGDFQAAPTDAAARRVVVDQVASLTDQLAISWHRTLVGDVDAASLGVWSPDPVGAH